LPVLKRTVVFATAVISLIAGLAASPALAAKGSHGHGGGGGGGGSTYVPGVDVSHYQGTINWSQVAGAGVRFAIQKATEGQTYVDPTYSTRRTGAGQNGIEWGAYHFARPDTASGDAVAEADHFVDTALPSSGDIIPALDLEVTGGLSTTALRTWVSAWMGRVTTRVGVRPMIYTSPNFWKTYMGDTTAFADQGYRILWIAHWTSNSQPTVPAANWGGYGWTFWQWTSCWTVPGISGCVDGDRYRYTDNFAQVSIP
jgi:GH25 family lysozyme M1 (1,4-beta-N-acetylmuramidase)